MRETHGLSHTERQALKWAKAGYPRPAPGDRPDTAMYPLTTSAVVGELRARGYQTDFAGLSYLIRKNLVTPEREGQRNYRWSQESVDQATQLLEEQASFIPSFLVMEISGVDPLQRELSLSLTSRRSGISDPDQLIEILSPGKPLSGLKRRVAFLAPAEFSESQDAVYGLIKTGHDESNPARLMQRYAEHLTEAKKVRQ